MASQRAAQNGKENARSSNDGSKRISQAPTSFSDNGPQWDGSQIPSSAYQQFSRDWRTTDQRFVPSQNSSDPYGSIYAPTNTTYGFSQNVFGRDPTLLDQIQPSTGFTNYTQTISPQALSNANKAINKTGQALQANSNNDKQNAQAGPSNQSGPPKPTRSPAPLSPRAPEFVYIDPTSILGETLQFPQAAFAVFEKFAIDLNIGDASAPKYIPRLSLNERELYVRVANSNRITLNLIIIVAFAERRGKRGDIPEVKPRKTKAIKRKVISAKPAPASSNIARPSTNLSPSSSSSDPDSDSSSMYSSSDDDEMDIDETPPLPSSRPTDEFEVVKYDTTKALWLPSRRRATSEEIKAALKLYWDLHKGIHDVWKAQVAALKKAESEQAKDEIPKLKLQVSKSLRMIDIAVTTALELGHKDILECLADVALPQYLISWLYGRVQGDDINGSLTTKILELLCRCTTLTESTLEKWKFDKLQPRFSKRGNDHTKALVKRLLDNVAAATKRLAGSKENEPATRDPKAKVDSGAPKPAESVSGAKRPREADAGGQPQSKRQNPVAGAVSGSASTKNSGLAKRPAIDIKKSPSLAPASSKQPSVNPVKQLSNVKVKANHVQARKSALFSSFSTSTQPGQRTSEGSAPTASMGEARPQNVFNFSTAIANLERKSDPESSVAPVNSGPPETPEEKRIRLKKEARRKLTKLGVRFKPADSLVQVRYITHEAEEDPDEGSHVRDARNDREEGRIFKQHVEKDMMDEEEDGGPGSVVSFKPWAQPSLIDFSTLGETIHHGDMTIYNANYLPRGGTKEPDSPEKKTQEQRETMTLMVVYTDPSDIPRTPREGSDLFSGEKAELIPFGTPWDVTKDREAKILQRGVQMPQQPSLVSPHDISSLLKTLKQTTQTQTQTQTQAPKPMTELERIFAQYSTSQPAGQPQTNMPATSSFSMPSFPASIQRSENQFQVPVPPQHAQAQQQIQAQQIQAILAQLGQGNTTQTQAFSGLPFQQQNQYQSYPGQGGQHSQHQGRDDQSTSYQTDRDDYYSRNPRDRPNRWGNGDSGGDRRGGKSDYGYGGHGEPSRGGMNGEGKKARKFAVNTKAKARLTITSIEVSYSLQILCAREVQQRE
ncbi:hypothetical protein FGG08_006692 [Glutinoglossum americanum]|uniref:Uncharacterized protein n=1 Tax=Glutinoglossum americanum TaxID=1670608 RepID=A0A9P8I0R0_9PEZI|nr:hypothetical protein FGG08_006692 [Glutinoglossum americanum]